MIWIVVPTIAGREETYARCVDAYENRTEDSFEIITVRDKPGCGIAWQEGADLALSKGAQPDHYLHLTADDLEPALAWDIDARPTADNGWLPAPRIWHGQTGQFEPLGAATDGWFTRIPFCTFQQWQQIGPMIPLHYYTDNWFTHKGRLAGLEPREVPSYAFRHWWAQHGRLENTHMVPDGMAYWRYKREGYIG